MGGAEATSTVWQPAQLQAAFADFELASEYLANHYGRLEQRVAELTDALQSSRATLENELVEKEKITARLSALLDALPGGVVVLDAHGRIAQFNPAATDLLGPLQLTQAWVTVVEQAFAPQWDDGHDISLRDGRRVNVATAACAGEPGQILLLKDVTETRRLQEQLNHHRRLSAQTELAAVLAHQVRTPLATALLQLGNIQRSGPLSEVQNRNFGKTLGALRRLERLVGDMLSYARGSVINPEAFTSETLIEDLAAAIDGMPNAAEFAIEIGRGGASHPLRGNRSALVSIMLNLIENARRATHGAGRLMISKIATDSTVEYVFTDDGPGVPEALRTQIFEPFFTSHKAGTGLGLAVAQSIARAHGGELSLASDYTGGARFVLALPIFSSGSAATPASFA